MDLSGLKWPIILAVVIGGIWLLSSGGTNFMIKNFTKAQPGADPARDKTDEAGLSRIGGFLMKTFRYEKAFEVFDTAATRYPNGANVLYNRYRMAKCAEKMEKYNLSVNILESLMAMDAHSIDDRVPPRDILRPRAEKLIEVHELRKR